jgi:ribonuclease PH
MTRHDGRTPDQLREIRIETGFTETPDASVLIRFGRTTVWCSASVVEEQPRWMKYSDGNDNKGWVTAEYEMLPGSTSPRGRRDGRRGSVSGRTQEIQRLIGRSLRAVTKLDELGPRTIYLDCDVLQADGGTRTASITGAYVALAIALKGLKERELIDSIPLRDSVAAVSCGIVDGAALLDLPYVEDVAADVDMNIVMTGSGKFVEVQGTGEEATFDEDEFAELLRLAKVGIAELTKLQQTAIDNA